MAEPVSWFLIEPGWEVVDRDGRSLGEVREVVGDQDADIFDGLHVTAPGGDEHYYPAERVGSIVERRVEVDAAAVDAADPPGGAELRRDRSEELGGGAAPA